MIKDYFKTLLDKFRSAQNRFSNRNRIKSISSVLFFIVTTVVFVQYINADFQRLTGPYGYGFGYGYGYGYGYGIPDGSYRISGDELYSRKYGFGFGYMEEPDTIAPIITMIGDDEIIYEGTVYTDRGATATDNKDGSISTINVTTSVNPTVPGNYFVRYNAQDLAGNNATEVTRQVTVLPLASTQTVLTTSTISAFAPRVAVGTNAPSSSTIHVPLLVNNSALDMSAIMTGTSVKNAVLPGEIKVISETSLGNVQIEFPADLIITGDSTWDGALSLPTILSSNTVVAVPDTGKTATVTGVIEIGFGNSEIIFNRPIRLVFAGQAGKFVGYTRSTVLTPIATVCTSDTELAATTQLVSGINECKKDSGADLVIWTRHFTKFATYTQSVVASGGGGGGGGGVTSAQSIVAPKYNSVTIADNVNEVDNPAVLLKISGVNASQMIVSNNADFSGSEWEIYSRTKAWTLTTTKGLKRVYVKFKDATGAISGTVSDAIYLNATTTTSEIKNQSIVFGSEQLQADAAVVANQNVDALLTSVALKRNLAAEKETRGKIKKIIDSYNSKEKDIDSVVMFITYGTSTTLSLGAGERAGVVNSFASAFGRIPSTAEDWSDVIKIANGRWPSQKSDSKEKSSTVLFSRIYLRAPDSTNIYDNSALAILSYGLRPIKRNLESENAATKTFKHIFGRTAISASDWDIIRTIAYSGASRIKAVINR